MASEPIPEPLAHQEVNSEREAAFPHEGTGRPELVNQAAPPIVPDRELPRAPRDEELKEAAWQKIDDAKQTASRAAGQVKQATVRAVDRTGAQAEAAYGQAKEKAAAIYDKTRARTGRAIEQARWRARYYIDEYPLHVIAGIAGAAFLAGVVLRIWRSNRDA